MVTCAYCNHPLICESCNQNYVPPSQDHYEALSRPEVSLDCPECNALLVCHWCKTPYGTASEDDDR